MKKKTENWTENLKIFKEFQNFWKNFRIKKKIFSIFESFQEYPENGKNEKNLES